MTNLARRIPIATFAAVTALIASFGSLYVAWRQSTVMERQLVASVWPALQFSFTTKSAGGDRALVVFGFRNGGIGPALIRAFDLSYRGMPITTTRELLSHCGVRPEADAVSLKTAPVVGNMIAAGERLEFFNLERTVKDESAWQKLDEVRSQLAGHVCYCSALNDCWLLDIDEIVPTQVKSCSDAARRPQYEKR